MGKVGQQKVRQEKVVGKSVKCCFEIYDPGLIFSFVRLFFFEILTSLQFYFRRLGEVNV